MLMSQPAPAMGSPLGRRFLTTDPGMIERFGDPFRPLEPECKVIQFDWPLTPAQLQRAGALVADRPDVQLYVYLNASRDLDFLQYFPTLRRLHVAIYELEDIAGFARVAGSLEELTFGQTRETFSLRFLESMRRLANLFLVRHKKHLPVVSELGNLTKLGLSGITLPDLSLLLPLTGLRDLSIFLGGTTNLALLPRLASLEALSLMRITKLSDLSMLGDLVGLKKLHLDWMRNVTSLPRLDRLVRLEEVTLDTMKGLTDLSPVAAAPALRKLTIQTMPQLTAENFRCLLGHPRLAGLWAYSGRSRVSEEVKRMFPGIAR
jgi:internalin A